MKIPPDARSSWRGEDIRDMAHRVADMVADYLSELPAKPVFVPVSAADAAAWESAAPPVESSEPRQILDEFAERIATRPFGNGHPRFWGWVNSPPAVMGVLADMLAAAMNPSVAGGNHAAVHVERQIVRWFVEMIGLPPAARGMLVSGGSMANLTALAAARHAHAGFDVRTRGLQSGDHRLTLYISEEGHGCLRKAAELMGLGSEAVRTIAVDHRHRMRVDALRDAIARDRADGCRPIAVAANAGTVNTGAIDPIADIATVCRTYGLWLHVDGAYGAAAILSTRYRDLLVSLALADSVALDPHKWLSVPVEAGLVLVRDGQNLRDAFSLVPPYLRTDGDPHGVGGPPWFSEYGFQQSRGFRALKVWMTLKYYGLEGYRRAIDHDIALAEYLADAVRSEPSLELMAEPSLSIVCFRVRTGTDDERRASDDVNRQVLEQLQLGGKVFLSSTQIGGRFVLRVCIVNPLSSSDDIDLLLAEVKRVAAEVGASIGE